MSAHDQHQRTSVADHPVSVKDDDKLDLSSYASALASFIEGSETPITVGMQGEWGSGKTSLMNLLRDELRGRRCAIAWVNTWEYAIFRSSEQVAPGVLRGLIKSLGETCEKENVWTESVAEHAKSFLRLGRRLLVGFVEQKTGGKVNEDQTEPKDAAEIAELRTELKGIIAGLTDPDGGGYERVVFFIDDLDRIEPSVAVEVLEALKNIFDVEGCVFILAIDYDVVVKGLERKFGKKTQENEREFRSFFDKIIQVPFSLPVSAYKIDDLLDDHFDRIGHSLPKETPLPYGEMTHLTVGAVPRSIKRLINVFSLLSSIRDLRTASEEAPTSGAGDPRDEFCLYGLLALQLAYPRVYRLLGTKPDFTRWDRAFAARHNIDMTVLADSSSEDELIDEEWEQVLFSFCEVDTYLKQRRQQILRAFNVLRDTMEERLPESIRRTLLTTSISAVEAADERGSTRATTRVDATDMLAGGLVSTEEELYFRDTNQGTVHEQIPLKLVPRTGAGGGFIVRIEPFGNVERIQVWSPTKGAWGQEKKLPAELPCKGASAVLHKQSGIYADEEIAAAYSSFGENDFVRSADPKTSLADVRTKFKQQRQ